MAVKTEQDAEASARLEAEKTGKVKTCTASPAGIEGAAPPRTFVNVRVEMDDGAERTFKYTCATDGTGGFILETTPR